MLSIQKGNCLVPSVVSTGTIEGHRTPSHSHSGTRNVPHGIPIRSQQSSGHHNHTHSTARSQEGAHVTINHHHRDTWDIRQYYVNGADYHVKCSSPRERKTR